MRCARTNDVDDACIAQLQCLHCNRIEIDVTDGEMETTTAEKKYPRTHNAKKRGNRTA